MIGIYKNLKKQLEELRKFHHKTLHELADAAQIIKSYEYLEQRNQREIELLEEVLQDAEKVCDAKDQDEILKQRRRLKQAIRNYKSYIRKENRKSYPSLNFNLSSHSHRSNTSHLAH